MTRSALLGGVEVRQRRALLLILALALLLRLVVFFALQPFPPLAKDDSVYDMLAVNMLAGNGFSASESAPYEPMAVRTPGYPAFLASVYVFAGRSWNAVRVVQTLLAILTVFVTFDLGRRLISPTAGLIAAGCYAVLPSAVVFPSLLLTESTQALLVVLFLSAWYRAADRQSAGWYAATGMLLAIATMQRPDYQLLIVPLLGGLLVLANERRRALRGVVVAAISFAAVILPWTARNYAVFGFTALSTGTGHTAMTAKFEAEGKSGAALMEAFRARYGATFKEKYGREMTYLDGARPDQDALRRQDFTEFVRSEPLTYAKHSLARMGMLWLPRSWTDLFGWRGDFCEATAASDRLLLATKAAMLLLDALVIGLAGLGGLLALRDWRRFTPLLICIAYATFMYGLIYSGSRYRIPLLPVIALLAASVVETMRAARASRAVTREELRCVAS